MTRRWGIAVAVAVLLLAACSSTSTLPPDTQTLLAAALTADSRVGAVVVGAAEVTVSYQEAGGLKVVSLSSPATPWVAAGIHIPSRSGDAFDARLIVETARMLATTCKDDNGVTDARPLSASAIMITTACRPMTRGATTSSSVNGHPLTVLSGGWTLENLTVLWADLSVVVPDAKVTQILLYEDHVMFSFASTMSDCPQIEWTRRFDGTSSARCAPAFGDRTVDTTRFTPLRMLDAVSTAGSSLPPGSPQSVLVIANPDSLQVFLSRGNHERMIEVAP